MKKKSYVCRSASFHVEFQKKDATVMWNLVLVRQDYKFHFIMLMVVLNVINKHRKVLDNRDRSVVNRIFPPNENEIR